LAIGGTAHPVELLRDGRGIYGIGAAEWAEFDESDVKKIVFRPDRFDEDPDRKMIYQSIAGGFRYGCLLDVCLQRCRREGARRWNASRPVSRWPRSLRCAELDIGIATTQKGTTQMNDSQTSTEQWLAIRKQAGQTIDPETAEVMWDYAFTLDPCGIDSKRPEDCKQVGREYFARAPRSEIWVNFGDLPQITQERLWEKHKAELAFPAGLPFFGT